jgi:hypothetical protein
VPGLDPVNPARNESRANTVTATDSSVDALYVRQLYRTLLSREADEARLNGWVAALRAGVSRSDVARGFSTSAEYRGLQVDRYYATYLHRQADAIGRTHWVNALLAGQSESALRQGFLTSAEYLSRHADTPSFLTGLYTDVLGRAPDQQGLAFWEEIARRGASREALAQGFLTFAEADLKG